MATKGGKAFSSICGLACDTKATHCPLWLPVLSYRVLLMSLKADCYDVEIELTHSFDTL